MRLKDKEINEPKELRAVLRQGQVCRLGLLDGNRVYIVPMNYGYADNSLYFHSAKQGKKVELLQEQGQVCFEVYCNLELVQGDTGCDWSMHYQSVIGYGRVEFLESRQDKEKGLQVIMAQYAPDTKWEFTDQKLDRTLVFELIIDEMSGKQSVSS